MPKKKTPSFLERITGIRIPGPEEGLPRPPRVPPPPKPPGPGETLGPDPLEILRELEKRKKR